MDEFAVKIISANNRISWYYFNKQVGNVFSVRWYDDNDFGRLYQVIAGEYAGYLIDPAETERVEP
jgi:hypothetical protein